MHFIDSTQVGDISIHFVGNQMEDERILLTESKLNLDDDIKSHLVSYFLTNFKSEMRFQCYHEDDLQLHIVYQCISNIFLNPSCLHEQSILLAKHLYSKSNHPKIKGGELYVVYFPECLIDGETTNGIGIFKSENKETFLKLINQEKTIEITSEKGLNLSKLDKGCVFFNTDDDNGYKVIVVDNTNKGEEAKYWIDEFLGVRQAQEKYFKTEATLTVYKDFVQHQLPEEYELNKADQADFLNRSMNYFKENETFETEEFVNEVLQHPAYIESFQKYKEKYEEDNEIQLDDEFEISDAAVKKSAKFFKSIIKLDKNFHIYIHGNKDKIENGEDEGGKYYKLYYEVEE